MIGDARHAVNRPALRVARAVWTPGTNRSGEDRLIAIVRLYNRE
jgi:hypothetical protein